jgi:membrane fusion protein, multidrug efflux system
MKHSCLDCLQRWGLCIAVAAPLGLAACSQADVAPEPVRSVKVLTVGAAPVESAHEFAGEVRPRVESRLGFRVAGKIIRRPADPGQWVQAGQVLAQLDPRDYQLAVDAARAQVAAATTSRDLAAADYNRYKALRDQNFISGAELERRDTTLKAAQAQLEQANAQLAAQGNQARYTNLVADVSGVVTAVEAEPGQVVAAGTPVVRIAQDGPRDVVFSVPEDKVNSVGLGTDVEVRMWADRRSLAGKVREVAATADPVTRTYLVKVALHPSAAPPLGATVNVAPKALSQAGVRAIKLPTSALRQEGQGSAVWVLDPSTMTLASRVVEVAGVDGNQIVVSAGLEPGMLVVSAGVHVLAPGQKVAIYQDRTAPPASVQQAGRSTPTPPGAAHAATPPAVK